MTAKLLVLAFTLVSAVGLAGCADNDDGEESTNDALGDAPDPTKGIDQAGGDVEDNETNETGEMNETNDTNATG